MRLLSLTLFGLLSAASPAGESQLIKAFLGGHPVCLYTGTSSGELTAVPGSSITFDTVGTYTLSCNRPITLNAKGRAGGGGGGNGDTFGQAGGGGGTGSYNDIGESTSLVANTNYTIVVGSGGSAAASGGESHFRLEGSTYYLRLGGGSPGTTVSSGGAGAGGTSLTGVNGQSGANGGVVERVCGAPCVSGSGSADSSTTAAGSGGGGGPGNYGGPGTNGGDGGLSGQAGESYLYGAEDGGGRGGIGGGTYGYGGGGGGACDSLADCSRATGRTGGSGWISLTVVSVP